MPYTAWPHRGCCSDPSPLIKAGAQLSAGHRCCPLLSPASCPRHAPRAPLDYEAPAGCFVGCLPLILVPLDLGKHLSVVSVCTGSSRSPTARLGDKCSNKPRLQRRLARGVSPVLVDHVLVAKHRRRRGSPRSASLSGISAGCLHTGRADMISSGRRENDRDCLLVLALTVRCGTRVTR
jgi:hypothetical protein